jgi:hypothetical protein
MTRQDIMNHHRQTMQAICAGIAAVALVVMGLVAAEQHYAHQALVNQEQVAWK